MRRQPAYRLDARTGWRVAWSEGIAWSDRDAQLALRPGTAVPLADPSGSLGGRAVPRRVSFGPAGTIFLITTDHRLLWYDLCAEAFAPVPCAERVGLTQPVALSVAETGELIVLDGASRMLTAIALSDWRIKRQWGPFQVTEGRLQPARATAVLDPLTGVPTGAVSLPDDVWDPRDIAVLRGGLVAVSDAASGQIAYFDRRGSLIDQSDGASQDASPLEAPDALAVGPNGALYVLEAARPGLARLDHQGRITARLNERDGLPETLEEASLAIARDGTIWVSNRLPGAARSFCCEPSGLIRPSHRDTLAPADCTVLAFDPEGTALLASPAGACLMRADDVQRLERGRIGFARLDGGQTETQWDRARITLDIPEGCAVTIWAYASDAALDNTAIAALPEAAWVQTPLDARAGEAVAAIRTSPGQYLWLQLELGGDGAASPRLAAMTITYPRNSSARYLPAVWSAEPTSADFLARLMSLYDELRADSLTPLEELAGLIDPMATPAAEPGAFGDDFLDWLAGWIGLMLDRNWSVARRRALVAEAPKLFRIKGTLAGLSRHIEIYTGLAPKIVEHFRLRRWIALDETPLDGSSALWGPDLVRRLSLDGYAEIGRFTLVDGGAPLTDPIAAFAHRASVFIPVSGDFSAADLAALEAVIEAARPAHVAVDLHVMRPAFVLGCDMLLGVNTVLGPPPAPAITDATVLGEDIRLGPQDAPFTIGPGTRLGADTTVA